MPDKEKTIFEDSIKNSEDGIAVLTENIHLREYLSEEESDVKKDNNWQKFERWLQRV